MFPPISSISPHFPSDSSPCFPHSFPGFPRFSPGFPQVFPRFSPSFPALAHEVQQLHTDPVGPIQVQRGDRTATLQAEGLGGENGGKTMGKP